MSDPEPIGEIDISGYPYGFPKGAAAMTLRTIFRDFSPTPEGQEEEEEKEEEKEKE